MSDGAGFLIFHGNRLENLRRLAVAWLGREPLPPLVPVADRTHRFAVLVFAKDEAPVIGPLLNSLRQQAEETAMELIYGS